MEITAENAINYWKLDKASLRFYYYAFIDTGEYLADQLFIKHEVKVNFGKEFCKEGANYRVIFCRVKKQDENEFLAALAELNRKMLLLGHIDYPAFCANIKKELPI
ncbi:MAG: hypothetical protein LUD78_03085 [Clostridiales bacterium]|nr:hypothetical protein [Clostridiales bacterium]